MYDHATTTLQQQTIQAINENTTKIETLNETIKTTTTTITIILTIMLIKTLITKCLGGK